MMKSSLQSMDPLFKWVESLEKTHRIGISFLACAVVIVGFVYFSIRPSYQQIALHKQSQQSLGQQVKVAKKKAGQLNGLKREWKMKEAEFRKVMRALPEKTEIPSLLTSISQSGQDTGLKFISFQPGADVVKDFYGEIPVSLKMEGNFHNTVVFLDKVTGLNRIVNIRDIRIGGFKDGKVTTECTALTYKFIEQKKGKK